MAAKSETLSRILSKTMAAGGEHVAKALKGEETLPEAAGAAVEDILSGSTKKTAPKVILRKAVKSKGASTAKNDSQRQKAKTAGK